MLLTGDFLTAAQAQYVGPSTVKTPGTVAEVGDRLGFVRVTNYGRLFDVKSVPNPTNLAYTAVGLGVHSDNPYRHPSPGVQLLHCLESEAPGGDTLLVDGFHAAEILRRAGIALPGKCGVERRPVLESTQSQAGRVLTAAPLAAEHRIGLQLLAAHPFPHLARFLSALFTQVALG